MCWWCCHFQCILLRYAFLLEFIYHVYLLVCLWIKKKKTKMSTSVFSFPQTLAVWFFTCQCWTGIRHEMNFPRARLQEDHLVLTPRANCTAECYKQLAAGQWLRGLDPVEPCFMQRLARCLGGAHFVFDNGAVSLCKHISAPAWRSVLICLTTNHENNNSTRSNITTRI